MSPDFSRTSVTCWMVEARGAQVCMLDTSNETKIELGGTERSLMWSISSVEFLTE